MERESDASESRHLHPGDFSRRGTGCGAGGRSVLSSRGTRARRPPVRETPLTATSVYSAQLSGTPFGSIRLWSTTKGIRRIAFRAGRDLLAAGERVGTDDPPALLRGAVDQLRQYLGGDRHDFDVPLDLSALTDFQLRVYDELAGVPWGTVITYGQLAERLGMRPGSARAVGGAVGANPVAIVVPCHRVVGSDMSLHGFSGGLARKAALLRHEGIVVDGESAKSRVHPDELRLPL